ncbi:hypothetical protein [Yersinia proxima]|uniref:hypothetical protein n=1 Tax=Yersinia proxima TaxID=2890316 RepID=UPI001D11BEA0|nr:hypothetical protein [Yersinia proxima]
MKLKIRETGWDEITTVTTQVESQSIKPFMNIGKWVEANKRIGLFHKRTKCQCCKTKWENISAEQPMFNALTSRGWKQICLSCCLTFTCISLPEESEDEPTA